MDDRSVVFGRPSGLWLVAVMGSLAFAGCNANVETRCFDGPCTDQDDPTTTTAAITTTDTGATTDTCQLSTDGSDACSDEPQDGDFPCEVSAVLEAKCQNCHGDPHASGAPIDLLTCDRFHEKDCGGSRSRFRMADYYLCSDYMPQGGKPLTEAEKKILVDWLAACAPCVAKGTGCSGTPGTKACFK